MQLATLLLDGFLGFFIVQIFLHKISLCWNRWEIFSSRLWVKALVRKIKPGVRLSSWQPNGDDIFQLHYDMCDLLIEVSKTVRCVLFAYHAGGFYSTTYFSLKN